MSNYSCKGVLIGFEFVQNFNVFYYASFRKVISNFVTRF